MCVEAEIKNNFVAGRPPLDIPSLEIQLKRRPLQNFNPAPTAPKSQQKPSNPSWPFNYFSEINATDTARLLTVQEVSILEGLFLGPHLIDCRSFLSGSSWGKCEWSEDSRPVYDKYKKIALPIAAWNYTAVA